MFLKENIEIFQKLENKQKLKVPTNIAKARAQAAAMRLILYILSLF